jgi:hypothetical protein
MDTPTPNVGGGSATFCWICGHAVDLRTCKMDEHGNTVHEGCYAARITMKDEALKQLQVRRRSHS